MAISTIPGAGIATDTLEAGDIAANAVGTSELADSAVTGANIATVGIALLMKPTAHSGMAINWFVHELEFLR